MLSEQASPAGQDAHGAHQNGEGHGRAGTVALAFASVGVVYGDIGTSPLYALREALTHAAVDGTVSDGEVIGIVSLLIWALFVIVTVKYVFFLLRADNRGEGGTLSLMALAQKALGRRSTLHLRAGHHRRGAVLRRRHDHARHLGAVGGRGPETRHAAVRALRHRRSRSAILVSLFVVQRRGTAGVARWFGPITVVWFLVLGGAGPVPHRRRPAHSARVQSACTRCSFLFYARRDRLRRAGRGLPRRHRRRGALRRHGPFRPQADPAGLDRARVSRRWC